MAEIHVCKKNVVLLNVTVETHAQFIDTFCCKYQSAYTRKMVPQKNCWLNSVACNCTVNQLSVGEKKSKGGMLAPTLLYRTPLVTIQ